MPRAIVTLITLRPRTPQPMPKAAHLRQFGLEIAEEAPKPDSASTRRSLLSALTGVAFTGTALAIAAPSSAQPDMPVSADMWEAALLTAYRALNPHEKETVLTMVRALVDRPRVTTQAMPASPDAELLAVLAEFDALEHQIFPKPAPATLAEEDVWMVWAEPLMARRRACLDRLCELETHTMEGFRARARSLLAYDDGHIPELEKQASRGYWSYRMQLALIRDLSGERSA